MLLTVLGCSGSLPGPGNPCSSYLIQAGPDAVLLDLGTGSVGAVLDAVRLPGAGGPRCATAARRESGDEAAEGRPDLHGVVISHLHGDHCGDLRALAYAMGKHDEWGSAAPHPIPVQAPEGARPDVAPWLTFEPSSPAPRRYGSLTVQQAPGRHQVPSWATRVSCAGRSVVYTGDTGPCAEVVGLARGADVLLCEAALAGTKRPRPGSGTPATHLAPSEAGQLAASAGCALLVLTHLRPWANPLAAVTEASEHFAGPVVLAAPGLRLVV